MKNLLEKQKFDIEAFEVAVYKDHNADIDRLVDQKTKFGFPIDFNVVSKSGLTPLQIAFHEDLSRIGYTLDENYSVDYRARLLKRTDINQTNHKKQNILHHIVCFRDFFIGPLFEKLVSLGADPNAQDQDGNTSFHIAMMGNSSGVGIDINLVESQWVELFWDKTIKNNLGQTPLFCAAANIYLEDISGLTHSKPLALLKDLGWDPSEVDFHNNTALHALALSLGKPHTHYRYPVSIGSGFNIEDFENVELDVYAANDSGHNFFELLNKEFVDEDVYNEIHDKFYKHRCAQQKLKLQDVLQDFYGDTIKRKI